MKVHTKECVKFSHYYNNDKLCPFDEHGCKFLHKVSQNCELGKRCKVWLCPRRLLDKEMDDHIDRDEEPYSDDEEQFSDNDSFVTSPPGWKTTCVENVRIKPNVLTVLLGKLWRSQDI